MSSRITEALLTAVIALLVILIAAEAYSDRATPSPSPVVSSSVQDVASHPAVRSEPVSPERAEPAPLTDVAGRVVGRAPSGRIAHPLIGGRVGYAVPGLGRYYLAMRLPRGTLVRICGPGACIRRTTNDYGPSSKIRPARLADLSWWDWLKVCGQTNHRAGLCRATATILETIRIPEPPATDTAP